MFGLKFKVIVILLSLIMILSFVYNRAVLPVVIEVSQKYAVTQVNKQINDAYNDIIDKLGTNQQDFTLKNESGYMSANTVVINKICADMAYKISDNLNNIENQKIKIPVGLFLYGNIFSDIGPLMDIGIRSMGEAKMDYDSSFKACGVNQVNYKLWLNVQCEVAVITPLLHKNVVIERKIVIIDMIYNGGVPNTYLNVQ